MLVWYTTAYISLKFGVSSSFCLYMLRIAYGWHCLDAGASTSLACNPTKPQLAQSELPSYWKSLCSKTASLVEGQGHRVEGQRKDAMRWKSCRQLPPGNHREQTGLSLARTGGCACNKLSVANSVEFQCYTDLKNFIPDEMQVCLVPSKRWTMSSTA